MKKLFIMLLAGLLLVGCGNADTPDTEANNGANAQQTQQETEQQTEEETIHEHAYTESITTEATCEADGVKTFTCECGDSYTETITATGHSYGEYVYNNDASTSADGTETATCAVCGGTDTRTKAGTKIEVSYDGYDEFGNGYVWGDDGYKHFDAKCPYPINEIADGGSELSFYGIVKQHARTMDCINILEDRYPGQTFPNSHREFYYLGYYNGQLIYFERWFY